ncbi:glycerophosphodiester phosphodiesterase [Aliifodinibius sp. S!AR15-10]|uniref:glycerophosphodiester phosphodiesterase n=1 Tax=Aliifodinibius sp. S!AR15-10 TaxID=2950437 RepID=UPI002858E6C7|nr:glycerophosphodiester phosphodiesterase [Aliifodinibius sp. S!AR15-10]MDR8389798.1 glycerophosphodiester phosphodiesterase [Aliifodinibius sp. S!AR15-10]
MSRFLIFIIWMALTIPCSSQQSYSPDYMLPTLFNDDGDDFVVIAHRGASAYFPENTMAAFKGALEMNAEMIELDVMLSKDGVPVVFHDAVLEDHTNGSGELSDYTLDELKQLDAGSWFSKEFAGEKIPTLEQVLAFARGKIALNIEIKTEAVSDEVKGGVEEKSLALVKEYGMQDHVLFSSFDYRAITHLKQLDPSIPAALLYNNRSSNKLLPSQLVSQYKADAFNCSYQQLNRKRLRDIRLNSIPVFVYTVNQKRRMKKLVQLGVSGIFSDKPDLLRQVAEKVREK